MAKSQEKEQQTWTAEEIGLLFQDLESKGEALSVLAKEVEQMKPILERIQLEMQAIGPINTELPAELVGGVRPADVFNTALHACIVGVITVMGPPQEGRQWEALADKCLTLSEVVYERAVKRYKLKNK